MKALPWSPRYSSNNRCFVVCVKREFEFDRHLPASNWIVVRIDCCHFHRFVFQENTEYYIREMRGTHLILWISTVHVSNRRSLCEVEKIFPQQRISAPPHFDAEVLCYPKPKIVLDYLSWRQAECHNRNQYKTCFWMLVKSGKGENKAHDMLKVKGQERVALSAV